MLLSLLLTTGLVAEQRTDVLDQAGVAMDVAVIVDASKLDRSTKKESSCQIFCFQQAQFKI